MLTFSSLLSTLFYSHLSLSLNRSNLIDYIEVKMGGLKALCSLVKTSGPILPHSVAKIISRFPLDSLSPSSSLPPPEETLRLLELLLACVTSGNRSLALPLTTAVHLFTEHSTASNDQRVYYLCMKGSTVWCTFLMADGPSKCYC